MWYGGGCDCGRRSCTISNGGGCTNDGGDMMLVAVVVVNVHVYVTGEKTLCWCRRSTHRPVMV